MSSFKDLYPNTPNAVLAKQFNMTVDEVGKRARSLNLTKSPEHKKRMKKGDRCGALIDRELKPEAPPKPKVFPLIERRDNRNDLACVNTVFALPKVLGVSA